MSFVPPRYPGVPIGLAVMAAILALDAALLGVIRANLLSVPAFVSLLLLLASVPALFEVGYRTYALARARYVLSRNALVVEWGGRRLLLPMEQVLEGRPGSEFDGQLRPRGLIWPGNVVGHASVEPLGDVEFLASTPQPGLVLLRHTDGWLAISPGDPATFLSALSAFQAEGIETAAEPESVHPAFTRWALWQDRLALGLIAAGALGALLLLGYLAIIAPQLPEQMALHFDAQGNPDRFVPASGLLILPLIAALAWLVNTAWGLLLHRSARERPAAYLLLGATIFVQVIVWAATISLLTAGNAA
jgi:hypothetical protein